MKGRTGGAFRRASGRQRTLRRRGRGSFSELLQGPPNGQPDRFSDNVLANTFNPARARAFLGDPDKVVEALDEIHGRGVSDGLWDFSAGARQPKGFGTLLDNAIGLVLPAGKG